MENFVKHHCEHCNGGIEFDISQLEPGESRLINCPHCQSETSILAPISDAEKERYKLVYFVNAMLSEMHERARNHFFGTGVQQSMFETYKWFYAIGEMEHMTGVNLNLNDVDGEELSSIASMSVDKLTANQIKEAHAEARKEIIAIFTNQSQQGETEAEANLRKPISSEVKREVWRRDEGKCTKCGSRERLEFDHIIPVTKGGSNTARNIELLCEACNRAKSATI
jgi:hypothetical protein